MVAEEDEGEDVHDAFTSFFVSLENRRGGRTVERERRDAFDLGTSSVGSEESETEGNIIKIR